MVIAVALVVMDTVFAEVLALVVGLMTISTASVLRGIRCARIVRRGATSYAVAEKTPGINSLKDKDKLQMEIVIGGIKTTGFVDSGSCANIISLDFAKKLSNVLGARPN